MELHRRTIREWRSYLKLSQKQVAEKAKVHPTTYGQWERNPEIMRVADTVKLAVAFDCLPEQIIFFESNPSLKLAK